MEQQAGIVTKLYIESIVTFELRIASKGDSVRNTKALLSSATTCQSVKVDSWDKYLDVCKKYNLTVNIIKSNEGEISIEGRNHLTKIVDERDYAIEAIASAAVSKTLAYQSLEQYDNCDDDFKEMLHSIGEDRDFFLRRIAFHSNVFLNTLNAAIERGELF